MVWEFERLDKQKIDKAKIPLYTRWMERALDSKIPNPIFSKYHVKGAAGMVLAIIAGSEGNLAGPCGNCRDILYDQFGADTQIVTGAPTGGMALVAKLSDYLFDNFKKLPRDSFLTLAKGGFITNTWETKNQGERLTCDPYAPKDIHPERRYFAALVTDSHPEGEIRKHPQGVIVGTRDIYCDYHPTYPIEDAFRQKRRTRDLFFDYVIIFGEAVSQIPPHVMYRDRQHLYEANLIQELLKGKEIDPPVYLVSQRHEGFLGSGWKTSVKEWLPYPFSPKNFGEEFLTHLKKYYST